MKRRYWNIQDGTALLCEQRKAGHLDYRVLRKGREWADGSDLAARYVIGEEIGAAEINGRAAGKLAKALGGTLEK
jgi:hypothetical protein